MYELIIVGGGPAAMTAAIYAARKELKFALIAPELGGEIVNTSHVENYPGQISITGRELAKSFAEHMKSFNIEHIEDAVTNVKKEGDIFKVKTYGSTYKSKTILWATGSNYRSLNIPGEGELRSRGVTYCSICDGPLFKKKTVAVIGTGNSALTSVIYMLDIAKKVYLVGRSAAIRADAMMVDKAKADPKLEILYNSTVRSINGEKRVESITILENGSEKTIPVDGVIINIGHTPITEPIKDIVPLDPSGYAVVDAHNMTSVKGLFAAGDVVNVPYKQIVIATGQGATAALGAYDYVKTLK